MSSTTAPASRMTAASLGKMPTTRLRRLISLLRRSSGLVRPDLAPVRPGEGAEGQHLLFGPRHERGGLGEALGECLATWSHWAEISSGLTWAKIGAEGRGHHLLVALGDVGQQVAGEVDPAALVGRPLEAAPDGGHQAGVLVRDDEAHAARAPGACKRAQEPTPEGLVFGVADVDAQDLPAPVAR